MRKDRFEWGAATGDLERCLEETENDIWLNGSEYLQRHNKALMVFSVEWGKKEALLEENAVWYKITWQKGTVLEKQGKKLIWDFEYRTRMTTSARRPDVTLEDVDEKHRVGA